MVLTRADIGPVDILKVGHHGSRFSSSEPFLAALEPALAVIQVGKNSYGHPTEDVLGRLSRIGATVLRTDEHGTVEVRPQEEAITIRTVR
jgi:competence protein ComEC